LPATVPQPDDHEKQLAAEAAAALVEDGMAVGLGTGSTVAFLLPALAARRLRLRCVATSPETARSAAAIGLAVEPFDGEREDSLNHLDVTIDGADQVAPDGWLVKGGHGAHTRERIVAAAADRFVVIVSRSKLVDRVRPPVPIELLRFGLPATLRSLGDVQLRRGQTSPDGGVIADYVGDVSEPSALASRLWEHAGVVDHGLFSPSMVSDVIIGGPQGVEHRVI
jgi:ribose 5-phosphate isomerase A